MSAVFERLPGVRFSVPSNCRPAPDASGPMIIKRFPSMRFRLLGNDSGQPSRQSGQRWSIEVNVNRLPGHRIDEGDVVDWRSIDEARAYFECCREYVDLLHLLLSLLKAPSERDA